MRREALTLTIVLLLASVPAVALPTPSPDPFVARGPIVIASDADFTAANGVRAGTGTPGDPYVINAWSITTGGVAIRISGVTKEFLVRDNAIDAGTGVQITSTAVIGVVKNNKFVVRGTGVYVANADARVVDNSFLGDASFSGQNKGVDLVNSNSVVESNAFLYTPYAIKADRGSPRILCNDIHDDTIVAGISVHFTTNATIDCNIITRCNVGISATNTIGTIISNNTIHSCYQGVVVYLAKDLTATNNTVRFSLRAQVHLEMVSGNFTGNVVIDGRAEGVLVLYSPVLVANNTIHNNLKVGLWLSQASGDIQANVITKNELGIKLDGGSIVHLEANVMSNNTVGIDIPYGSRQAIVNMSANIVNGVNIDGTVNATQKVYFYKESNVTISGQVRDSGFSAGFYGSITAQGGIVLYEVNTANITGSVISHHNVGVGVTNSFNVQLNGTDLIGNLQGVIAANVNVGVQVPPCVVSLKKVNITIPVDPIATVGVDLQGCLGLLANVTVSVVDTGIRVDATASAVISNTTVYNTNIGLDAQGRADQVNISHSAFVSNRIGARFTGTTGVVSDSRFESNAVAGIRLERGSQLDLLRNNITLNGAGVIDTMACSTAGSCSSVDARGNVFFENRGDGIRVNGTSSFRGDLFLHNEGSGARLGSATLRDVVVAGNEGTGASIVGNFYVDDSVFTQNGLHGIDVRGKGELWDSNFTRNERAGIRVTTTSLWAFGLNVSHNFDGILADEATPGVGTLPSPLVPESIFLADVVSSLVRAGSAVGASPLDVHRSLFFANERDAIRMGAAIVNATHNYYGRPEGPSVNVGDQVGAFSNGVSPAVRFIPFYVDEGMTTTGPVFLL